jgi:hypothetical protein
LFIPVLRTNLETSKAKISPFGDRGPSQYNNETSTHRLEEFCIRLQ